MVAGMIPPMSQPKIEILPLKKGFLRAASEATHVLVRIVAPSQPADVVATPRAPLDLALVIDRSGSMSGRPLEAALESAVRIVRGLRIAPNSWMLDLDSLGRHLEAAADEEYWTPERVRQFREVL